MLAVIIAAGAMPARAHRKGDQLSPIHFESFVCARSGARYTPPEITTCSSAGTGGNAPFGIATKLFDAY